MKNRYLIVSIIVITTILIIGSMITFFGYFSNESINNSKVEKEVSKVLKEYEKKLSFITKEYERRIERIEINLDYFVTKENFSIIQKDITKLNNLERETSLLDLKLKKLLIEKHNKVIFHNNEYNVNFLDVNTHKERPYGYIDMYQNDLYFVSGRGEIIKITNYKSNAKQNKIKSNLSDFNLFIEDEITYFNNFVRDILITEDSIYIVILKKIILDNKLHFSTQVLKGNLNYNNIEFENFFSTDLLLSDNVDVTHGGGRIIKYINDSFLLTVPDFNQIELIQDENNIYGKIILIDNNRNFKIYSKGHRNPQGIVYDEFQNKLLASEHGPAGGDEINLIIKNKNYGWPVASYGQGEDYIKYTYHKKHGFEEPLYFWENNPGVSEIIKINSDLKFIDNYYVLSSLSGLDDRYGNHLYLFKLRDDDTISKFKKIYLDSRIRDLYFDEKNNNLIFVQEKDQQIGFINFKSKNKMLKDWDLED